MRGRGVIVALSLAAVGSCSAWALQATKRPPLARKRSASPISLFRAQEPEQPAKEKAPAVNNVAAAPLLYALVVPLQATALLTDSNAHLAYFLGLATLTVHLGATADPIRSDRPPDLTLQAALLAPVAASTILLGLYALIKYYGFDPSTAYRLSVCSLALLATRDVAVQIIAAVWPPLEPPPLEPKRSQPTAAAQPAAEAEAADAYFGEKQQALAFACSLALVLDYALDGGSVFFGDAWFAGQPWAAAWRLLEQNTLAWALAIFSIGTVSLRAFKTAAIFLAGLFVYDIVWVFSSDVMMTVATKSARHCTTSHLRAIDAPVKLLALNPPDASYPYALLGLGDVAIPAFFVALMEQLDRGLGAELGAETKAAPGATPVAGGGSYRRNATVGYALGLCAAFYANANIRAGQPALLYLVPAVLGSALLTAWSRGEVERLLEFEAPVTSERVPLDLALLSKEERNAAK